MGYLPIPVFRSITPPFKMKSEGHFTCYHTTYNGAIFASLIVRSKRMLKSTTRGIIYLFLKILLTRACAFLFSLLSLLARLKCRKTVN